MPHSPADSLKPLLTPEAWELLNSLPPYSSSMADETNITLREQGWEPQTVAAVLTQLRLRRDAQAKFGSFADRMLLTDGGLQQSTRLPVAARHALRFRQAGLSHVADLGCGLGADSLAFASAGLGVTAVDADETTAAAAYINLRPFPEAQVVHSTAEDFAARHGLRPAPGTTGLRHQSEQLLQNTQGASGDSSAPPKDCGLWLDPARRNGKSRLWDPEEFSPPLSFVTELASTGLPLGVKLGPGVPHELIPENCEAEWVSVDGELVEVVLWFNALARRTGRQTLVRRAATVLSGRSRGILRGVSPENRSSSAQANAGLGGYGVTELTSDTDFGEGIALPGTGPEGLTGILWEPDPAVIRAGLVAELCERLGGRMLDERIAYFCTPVTPTALTPSIASETPAQARHSTQLNRVSDGGDEPLKSGTRMDAEHPGGQHQGTPLAPLGQETPAITPEAGPAPATPETRLARGYRILDAMGFSAKRLKRWCAEHQVTSVEIKKRGVDVTPEQLRKQILPKRPKGQPSAASNHATLMITRLGDKRLVAVVQPLS